MTPRLIAAAEEQAMMDAHSRGGSRLPLNPSVVGAALGGALLAGIALLALYFGVLTALSNWEFAVEQFGEYGAFIVALAIGFGLQAGLFIYLHQAVHAAAVGKVLAASGTTSGVAMLSCCTHYLVNLVPVLGATGLMTFVSEYQVQLLWVGVAGNLAGIAFMTSRLVAFARGA